MAAAIRRGLRFERARGRRRRRRRGGAAAGARHRVRRDRARRDAARPGRLRDLPAAARGRRLGAGADADRARRRRGPRARARRGRRRLPDQAVLARGAARRGCARWPGAARWSGRRCSRSAICGSTRPRARCGAATRRSSCRPASSRCSRRSCAGPARCSPRSQLLEAAWDLGYEQRSNVVEVYVRYLREKIDRPFGVQVDRDGARRRLPAAQGRRQREPAADPRAADGRVRRSRWCVVLGGRRRCSCTCGWGPTSTRAWTPGWRAARRRWRRPGRRRPAAAGDAEEGFAQVLDDGRERARRDRRSRRAPGAHPGRAERVAGGEEVLVERRVPGIEGTARVLAQSPPEGRKSWPWASRSTIATRRSAASSRRSRSAGRSRVLLASLLGYALAAAGLRPVEAMRRRAAEVSLERDDERLPLPAARDEIRRLGETLNEMLDRLRGSYERERALRRRRQPRAAHAGGGDQDRARGRAARGRTRLTDVREALVAAVEECDHLAQLAEDLLVLARTGEGGLPVRPADARPRAALLGGVRERFADRAACTGRAIAVDAADGLRLRGRRAAPAPGARQPGGQRAAPRRRATIVLPPRAADGARRARGRRRGPRLPAGARASARSSASRAATSPAPAAAPGRASRSCARSPRRTAAAPRSSAHGPGATVRISLARPGRRRIEPQGHLSGRVVASSPQSTGRRGGTGMTDKIKGRADRGRPRSPRSPRAVRPSPARRAAATTTASDEAISGQALDRASAAALDGDRRRQGDRDRGRRRGGRLRGRGHPRRRQPGRRPPRQGLQGPRLGAATTTAPATTDRRRATDVMRRAGRS